MPEYYGSSKKEDEEKPLDSYKEYRKNNPKERTARKEAEIDGTVETQIKSYDICQQEFLAHQQNFEETFSKEESNEFFKKLKELRFAKQIALRKEQNG